MAILGQLCALGAFVCCVLIGIKGIQAKDVGLGVVSIICWIVALVMAFTKQAQWGISNNLRLALIVLVVASFALNGLAVATAGSGVVAR